MKRLCVPLAGLVLALGLLAAETPAKAQIRLSHGGGEYALAVVSFRDIPFRTVVRQRYDFSCGAAALATLLRYHYGRDVGEQDVFLNMLASGDRATIERAGFSLLDMKRYLETYGFEADGFRLTLDELSELQTPAIVVVEQVNFRHFVVVKGIRDDEVLVGDPALGLKTYTRAQFEEMWNGVAFMIRDPADRFNAADEWMPFAQAPLRDAIPSGTLAALTRELPPQYQITRTFAVDPYLR